MGPIRSARPAWRMSGTPELVNEGAPLFGEHTEGVLTELGYNAQEILELRAEGVVA